MMSQPVLTIPKPKEHGAWGMLYVPLLIAAGMTQTFNIPMLLLTLVATLVFLSQRPFVLLMTSPAVRRDPGMLRRNLVWLAVYWVISSSLLGVLVFQYRLEFLIHFGVVAIPIAFVFTFFVITNRVRTVPGEIGGISGLTLTGPLAHYVAVGQVQAAGLWLWMLSILYFSSSVFYVKAVVAAFVKSRSNTGVESPVLARICSFYHLGLLGLIAGMVALDKLPVVMLIAFLPVIVRGLWGIRKPRARLNFARIGWTEVVYSLFFAVATIAAMRPESFPR